MKIILHENPENGTVIISFPSQKLMSMGITIHDIAKKTVAAKYPYWIKENTDISQEQMMFFEALELDRDALGKPDGYGADLDTFPKNIMEVINAKN